MPADRIFSIRRPRNHAQIQSFFEHIKNNPRNDSPQKIYGFSKFNSGLFIFFISRQSA